MLYKDVGDSWADSLMEMMKNIEEEADCSGLFRENSIYLFSNVNNGVPKKRCFEEIVKRTDDALVTLYATAVFPFVLVMLFLISSTGILLLRIYQKCNICKDKEKDQKEPSSGTKEKRKRRKTGNRDSVGSNQDDTPHIEF